MVPVSADRALARSRRLGESTEAAVIDAVPQLEYVPDSEDRRVDARFKAVFSPGSELKICGLPVVGKGTPVEIKSCAVVYGESNRRGRWHFRREQHEHLEDVGGLYLLAVAEPHSRDVVAALIAPANAVRHELLGTWIETDDRPPYCKISWSRVFDPSELQEVPNQ